MLTPVVNRKNTDPVYLFIYLFIHTTTSSIVPEAISVEVMMTLTENTMKGDGKEEGG